MLDLIPTLDLAVAGIRHMSCPMEELIATPLVVTSVVLAMVATIIMTIAEILGTLLITLTILVTMLLLGETTVVVSTRSLRQSLAVNTATVAPTNNRESFFPCPRCFPLGIE